MRCLQQPLRSSPTPFWYPGGHHHKAHKLFQRPAVIRKTRRLSRKSLDPLASGRLLCTTTTALLAQASMCPQEVVRSTHQPHPCLQRSLLVHPGAATTHQRRQPGAKGGVQSLYVGGG